MVDSFQPVSSRSATPRSPSMARTRRVSTRSCATRATGLATGRQMRQHAGRGALRLVFGVLRGVQRHRAAPR